MSDCAREDRDRLAAVAGQFSYGIEVLEDGVLFNVAGLDRLIGKPEQIARRIVAELKKQNIAGNVAVAETVDTALLLALQKKGVNHTVASPEEFQKLPLAGLDIGNDSLGIFYELGVHTVEDLRQVPVDDLINRYGQQFRDVLDTIDQKGVSFITPNVKESNVRWNFNLDFPVEDFEQLIFIINHGLDSLFRQVDHLGFSTEHLDISFQPGRSLSVSEGVTCKSPLVSKGVTSNTTTKTYEIKTSFPTLDKAFWLKIINLRVSLDPPETGIVAVEVAAHFTKPRNTQRGLYAVSRPEPESLLLTVGKLKKLVGEDNVGVPVLLDERLAEAFTLDAEKLPAGTETLEVRAEKMVIAFTYFRPPLRAEVLVRNGRLVFIKTRTFSGHVTEYSGVWRANSKWWSDEWRTQEWDIEVETNGIYRLSKSRDEWFVLGEYD